MNVLDERKPGARPADPWVIGPAPDHVRYLMLGEDGADELLLLGHDLTEDTVAAVLRKESYDGVLVLLGMRNRVVTDRWTLADLGAVETWARQTHGCPRHQWLPDRVRRPLAAAVGWVLDRAASLRWRLDVPRPAEAWAHQRAGGRLAWFADCRVCEYADHHHTCPGCGWCDEVPVPPPWWDWSEVTPNRHAGRPGYLPVTVIDLS